jgi:hypothetical protein
MPSAGFEHEIPTIKRLQNYALDGTATGIGIQPIQILFINDSQIIFKNGSSCYKISV